MKNADLPTHYRATLKQFVADVLAYCTDPDDGLGWFASDIAHETGLCTQTVYNLLSGETMQPRMSSVVLIAKAAQLDEITLAAYRKKRKRRNAA